MRSHSLVTSVTKSLQGRPLWEFTRSLFTRNWSPTSVLTVELRSKPILLWSITRRGFTCKSNPISKQQLDFYTLWCLLYSESIVLIWIVSVANFAAKSSFPRKTMGSIAELTRARSLTSANCVESVSTVRTTWRDTRTVCIATHPVPQVSWWAAAARSHSLPTTLLQVSQLILLWLLAGNQQWRKLR